MNSFFLALIGAGVRAGAGQVSQPPAEPVSTELYDLTRPLWAGTNTTKNGFYFFKHYETANYQNVVNDKGFFYLYSTDHDPGAGGLFLGKGDDIRLTDFVEVGLIMDGNQIETPDYFELGGVSYLYCHSPIAGTDTQQTRLFTYSGPPTELHLMDWVEQPYPLGLFGDDNHTGYTKVHDINQDRVIATHIRKGGLPQPWARSVSTDGGYTFTREEDIDTITGIESGFFFKPSIGSYFYFNGFQWWIGVVEATTGGNQKIIVAKSNGTDYGSVTQKAVIFSLSTLRVHSVKIVGRTAYVQFTRNKESLFQGLYDLNNLYNY